MQTGDPSQTKIRRKAVEEKLKQVGKEEAEGEGLGHSHQCTKFVQCIFMR